MSTARIVLRSLGRYDCRIPIVSNPYTYIPLVNLGLIGRRDRDERHSLAQLSAIFRPVEPEAGFVQAQYYSYRSLLTFKLLKESPLPFREGLKVMRSLIPLFGILGVHHEDRPTPQKFCLLRRSMDGSPDRLEVQYRLSPVEEENQARSLNSLVRCFRRLGCLPIKRIHPGHGSSIHYAGTFPFSEEARELTCDREGRLRGTKSVYLGDGSAFASLPAKGLTLTLMANAHRVGSGVAEKLKA